MQPNLFTMVLRHPDADDLIVHMTPLDSIAGVALGASPVFEVFIVPAQTLDEFRTGQEIIDQAIAVTLARACVGGFDVSDPAQPWQDEIFRALDCTARLKRQAKAKQAKAKTRDTTLEADRAKERARASVLDHTRDKKLFELEARARLSA